MAITTDFNTGFEHGLASVNGVGLFDSLNAACTITSTGGEVRNGTYAGKLTYAAAAITFNKVAADSTKTKGLVRVAFKVITAPTSTNIAGIFVSRRVDVAAILAEVNSSGQIQVQHTTGSIVTGPGVNDGAWHVLEMQFDSGVAGTLDWRVDGVPQTQATGSTTSSNIASWRCGSLRTTTAGTIVVDDWINGFWTSTSDWYGDGKGVSLLPGSDGTHSFTANDFSTGETGTQRASSYTDFYTMVDDAPPWSVTRSTTDNIAQRVVRTTGYVEIKPATASSSEPAANAVRALMSYSSAATQANTMGAIVRNSAGTANVLWGDLPTAQGGNNGALADYSENSNFFKSITVTKPAGTWTNTEIDAIRWRIGGADDISPVPTVQNLMLEIDYPYPPATLTQAAFRFYEDGTETGSTATDAQDTNITRNVASDSNIQLRLRMQETVASSGLSTDDYQLMYSQDGGTYLRVLNSSGGTVDSYNESNKDTFNGVDGSRKGIGQSFTPSADGYLSTAKFYIAKSGSPTGSAVAKVYAHTGTYGTSSKPTGTALATSDNFDPSTLTASYVVTSFTFSGANQILLSSGVNYVVTLEWPGSAGATILVGCDNSSSSHAGNSSDSSLAGVWGVLGLDLSFYVDTAVPAIKGYNSASLTDGNATTNRLGAGSGSFVAGKISEDGRVDDLQITASNYTELLYSLTMVSSQIADTDTFDFKVYGNDAVVDTYTVTPRITVANATVTTRTILGKSNIVATTLRTILGKAAIQKTTTQTITGRARIGLLTTPTITGLARITATTTRTILGVANIRATTTRTIAGRSRIQVTTTKTITGKASIAAATTRTVTGIARITASTLRTITGVARVTVTATQTITGRARITVSTSRTITGLARITAATTRTITGVAKITATTTRTITGKAAIQKTTTQTITGISRVTKTVTQTILGRARITIATTQTITGRARITVATARTITGLARITAATTRTVTGVARITVSATKTITGISRITAGATRTITGLARITASTTQTITGRARVTTTPTQTETGRARIELITARTITGVANIASSFGTTTQTILGKAAIQKAASQTITGISRITAGATKTITGVARITAATTRTITGISRISAPTTRTILGRARITVNTLQTITGRSRISSATTRTETGVSRIQKSASQTITGRSRIATSVTQTILGRARVSAPSTRTITGRSRITAITIQTTTGVSRISAGATRTITGKAAILGASVNQTITGVACIVAPVSQTATLVISGGGNQLTVDGAEGEIAVDGAPNSFTVAGASNSVTINNEVT